MRSLLAVLVVLSNLSFANVGVNRVKMYDEPHAEVSEFCDSHTLMTLGVDNFNENNFVNLENKLTGTCELAPPRPDFRAYKLSAPETGGCNEKIYTGKSARGTIEVIDNSSNYCEVVLPGIYVVTETLANGGVIRLYSAK